jgi:signal transduction histidine kinase
MNLAAISAFLGGGLCLFAATLAFLVSRAPGWRDIGAFTWVALTAGLAIGCNATNTLPFPPEVYVWSNRLQVALLGLHCAAWHVYVARYAGLPLGPGRRALVVATALVGAAALAPGLTYGSAVSERPLPWLGVTYHDVNLPPSGMALIALLAVSGLAVLAQLWRCARLRLPRSRSHFGSAVLLFLLVIHDAAVEGGMPTPAPFLLDFVFAPIILVLTYGLVRRLTQDAIELRTLKQGLELAVIDRTRALEATHAALVRHERLAALGQFCAVVAHEVNNPAAVIGANLGYLKSSLPDNVDEDVVASLHESATALRRITDLSRQLLHAGRSTAADSVALGPVEVGAAVREAVRAATARVGRPDVAVAHQVAEGLLARADEGALVQILSNLVVNAIQAIPPDRSGEVAVRAERHGDGLRILVEDDGTGMTDEVLRRLFEPFYTTKPAGVGTGLGLAVSKTLVGTMGGELRFESAPGQGTRAILDLAAAAGAPASAPPAPSRSGAKGGTEGHGAPRLLIVDDDPVVRSSLGRLLGVAYRVESAGGVREALERVQNQQYDVILCDVMMPEGGGIRFWEEVATQAPDQTGRVVFLTGGAASSQARAFLDRQSQPVLEKPIDLGRLAHLIQRLVPG